MINTKTYITKSNTIIAGSAANTGKNAVVELMYGKDISRALLYFDHEKVKRLVEDKTYPDINKLRHVLKMTNAGHPVPKYMNCVEARSYDPNGLKQRAQSFDLIFFLIPNDWDEGRGAAHFDDMYDRNRVGYSDGGSNWYKYRNGFQWEDNGIYSNWRLANEVNLYVSNKGNMSNVIIGHQHFDNGNENIELDITCIFNKFINGELKNHGIAIAFSPAYEDTKTKMQQSVCFFSNNTHTFFEPYVETTYDEAIEDDRVNFYLDKDNKLYFYAAVGGRYVNLDECPTCTIEGEEKLSKQATKGVYYIDVNLPSTEYEADTMLSDIWSNIKYNGKELPDVELTFTTKPSSDYFSFGLPTDDNRDNNKFIPTLYGINQSERVKQGEIRKISVLCRVPYTSNQQYSVDGLEYRLYVNSGDKELVVISWSKVERGYNENYLLINTSDLLPSRYHIDIRVSYNTELILHKDLLCFDIVSDITDNRQ